MLLFVRPLPVKPGLMSPKSIEGRKVNMSIQKEQEQSKSDYLQQQASARRDFLHFSGAALAAGAGVALLGKYGPELIRRLSVQYGPQNNVDIVSKDERNTDEGVVDTSQSLSGSTDPVSKSRVENKAESIVTVEDERISGFNLWDTVDLSNSQHQIALIVVSRDNRLSASSTAIPLAFSDENYKKFGNVYSYTTLSYVPFDAPYYVHNPRTLVHSGIEQRHKFFAGRFEEALRTSSEGVSMTTDDIVKKAVDQYSDATAYLLQAKYDDGFKPLGDLDPKTLDKLLTSLPGVNMLKLKMSALVRVPKQSVSSFTSPEVMDDPLSWLSTHATALGGFGFEKPEGLSRWYISFCAGSSSDEKKANDDVFHINEGRWEAGFSLIDRVQNFDPSA